MSIKKTLLTIVQDVLSVLDSEEVNSISDSTEAKDIAEIVESVYFDIVSQRSIPETKSFVKLEALADSDYPTHFKYPANANRLERIWYDASDDGTYEYREIYFVDPIEFIERQDTLSSNYTLVEDKTAGIKIRVGNDEMPTCYTSFDDEHIVMNSFKSTVDSTLQASKSRGYGVVYPEFQRSNDTFVPDIDAEYFPYLIAESKSRAMDIYKGGTTPKIDQAARRNMISVQNKKHRTSRGNRFNDYGR